MSRRTVVFKTNEIITPCPKCGNNTTFVFHSEQTSEDGCEVWAVCKCGHKPSTWKDHYEDVYGGVHDDNCNIALQCSWNEVLAAAPSEELTYTP